MLGFYAELLNDEFASVDLPAGVCLRPKEWQNVGRGNATKYLILSGWQVNALGSTSSTRINGNLAVHQAAEYDSKLVDRPVLNDPGRGTNVKRAGSDLWLGKLRIAPTLFGLLNFGAQALWA